MEDAYKKTYVSEQIIDSGKRIVLENQSYQLFRNEASRNQKIRTAAETLRLREAETLRLRAAEVARRLKRIYQIQANYNPSPPSPAAAASGTRAVDALGTRAVDALGTRAVGALGAGALGAGTAGTAGTVAAGTVAAGTVAAGTVAAGVAAGAALAAIDGDIAQRQQAAATQRYTGALPGDLKGLKSKFIKKDPKKEVILDKGGAGGKVTTNVAYGFGYKGDNKTKLMGNPATITRGAQGQRMIRADLGIKAPEKFNIFKPNTWSGPPNPGKYQASLGGHKGVVRHELGGKRTFEKVIKSTPTK